MPIAADTIDEYFKRYGWTFQRLDDNNWRTGFRGDVASYIIRVRTAQTWIYFMIVPFVVTPKRECAPRLHYYLLRANQEMNAAKFYVDSDDDVVLAVELPADELGYSEFERALNALSWYADEHYLAVLNLAQVVGAPSKYEQGQAQPPQSGQAQAGSTEAGQGQGPGQSGAGTSGGEAEGLDWGDEGTGSPGGDGSAK